MSKRILYFVADSNPTEAELTDAARYGTRMFRNVQYDSPEQGFEECDGVAGCAPQRYVEKFGLATPMISGTPSPGPDHVQIPPPPPAGEVTGTAAVAPPPWGNIPPKH
jgi:hypothetical protein